MAKERAKERAKTSAKKKPASKKKGGSGSASAQSDMRTKWSFYYWSDAQANGEGQPLQECMERYGVGGWYSKEKDMVAALVFLSPDRTAGNSWMLGVKHLNGRQEASGMYEDDPSAYHLEPDTERGQRLTSLLAESDFEKA